MLAEIGQQSVAPLRAQGNVASKLQTAVSGNEEGVERRADSFLQKQYMSKQLANYMSGNVMTRRRKITISYRQNRCTISISRRNRCTTSNI
jgi:hypothetical protein